jgi:GAF domain-containing protein
MRPAGDNGSFEPLPETSEALRELARLGEVGLGPELHALAQRVRSVVPELVGVSLAAVDDGVVLTLVSSSEELAALDAVQYVDGGPCVEGIEEQELIDATVTDLLDEGRWQLYARAGAAAGVASSLSMPLLVGDRVVGGVNLYASTPDAFQGRHEAVAEAVGSDAAFAVANADLGLHTFRTAAEAPERLRDDREVNIALGVIAARQDVSLAVARDRLRDAAARAGITEAQAARALLGLQSS